MSNQRLLQGQMLFMNPAISKAHLLLSAKDVPQTVTTSMGQIHTQTWTQRPQSPHPRQMIKRTNMPLLHSQMGSKEQSLLQPIHTNSMMPDTKKQLPVMIQCFSSLHKLCKWNQKRSFLFILCR